MSTLHKSRKFKKVGTDITVYEMSVGTLLAVTDAIFSSEGIESATNGDLYNKFKNEFIAHIKDCVQVENGQFEDLGLSALSEIMDIFIEMHSPFLLKIKNLPTVINQKLKT
jgi:hypothetical protein